MGAQRIPLSELCQRIECRTRAEFVVITPHCFFRSCKDHVQWFTDYALQDGPATTMLVEEWESAKGVAE